MTHSLVMRLSNSNPHTSGAQPPLPPKPAAHPRQSRRQENRRQHISYAPPLPPSLVPYGEYVRLQIGVKERWRGEILTFPDTLTTQGLSLSLDPYGVST